MVLPGQGFNLILLAGILIMVYMFMRMAETKRYVPNVRPLEAFESIPEAVGRAAELGKPIHYTTGLGSVSDQWAAMTVAGMAVMTHVVDECAARGVWLQYTACRAAILPAVTDIIKGGYAKAGHPELFNEDMINYVGDQQRSFMATVMGYFAREKPAVSFIFGAMFWESIVLLGSAAMHGIMQIGGTPRLYYQPYYVCMCDYVSIGEELYAIAARARGDLPNLGSIAGQDYMKVIGMVFVIISGILATAGMADLWTSITIWP
jgi:hypothetical protein